MKKLLMALALLPLMAAAETEVVEGIVWKYTIAEGRVTIGNDTFGGDALKNVAIPCSTSGAVTIPLTLGGCPVKRIGEEAFFACSKLTSITIPESVVDIGFGAFEGCSGLTTMSIPSSVTSIGSTAFDNCNGLCSIDVAVGNVMYASLDGVLYNKEYTKLICCPGGMKGNVAIPSSVMSIRGMTSASDAQFLSVHAFYYCSGVTFVMVDEGNQMYSSLDGILYNKAGTELLYCPNGKKGIVTISEKVINVDYGAFLGCSHLTSIIVDADNSSYSSLDGVLYNKDQTDLLYCPGGKIGEVMIPPSVTGINVFDMFFSCRALSSITVAPDNQVFSSIDGVLYNKAQTELIRCPIADRSFVRIPSNTTSIGRYAFLGCVELASVMIPSNVVKIGAGAFENCDLLTTVCVDSGDVQRIKGLLEGSGKNVKNIRFTECGAEIEHVITPGEKVAINTSLVGYTASGLPSGLKYNKTTGMITGAVTKPTAAEGVIVKFTKSGAETEEMTIVVGPPPKIGVALEGDTDGCKVTGAGAYLVGKKVTLKVTTKKGTAFAGFYKDGEPWPNEADCKKTSLAYTMGKDDVSLVAKFEKEKMSVGCAGLSDGSFTAGVAGSPEGIPLEIETQSGVKSVKVEKLPAGMKYDAKKKVITGAPTKAGDNKVVITVTAVSGAVEKKEIAVPVAAMAETAVGTFNGFVANGEQRIGTFTLTTTDAGRLTAKVITAGGTVSFSGACWDSLEDGVCKVTLRTKKGEFMTLALDSGAAWDANQLTGTYSPPNMTGWFDLSAQRNAFGKTWYFTAVGDEQTGWTFAYTKDAKAAALTVTLKADGSTAIAGKLGAIKVSASGYANVGGMTSGAIIADFAPIVTVNKIKRALSIRTNLWFDRSKDHAEGAGGANLAE